MAIRIPIISDFDTGGIEKAVNQFKKLETNAERTSFLIKKSFIPATAALAGLAVAGFGAAKAAAEDQAQQAQLANQLKNTTGATDAQIAANEKFISTISLASATADDELRPALASLVRGTQDLGKAQDLLKISLDVAAGTGKNLAEVSDAVAKAYGGNTRAIKQLSPELFQLVKDGASADQVMQALSKTFGGAATLAANSAQGQFRNLGIQFGELKETIGTALLPVLTTMVGVLTDFAVWAQSHTGVIVGIGTAIAAIATAIIAVNVAFKLYRAAQLITIGVNYALATSFTAVEIATGIGIVAVAAGIAAFALYKRQMNGMKDSLGAFTDGAQQSNQQLIRMADAGKLATDSTATLTKTTGGAGAAVDTMKQKIDAARKAIEDKFSKALDDANSKLQKARDAYSGFAKDISGSLTGNTSFSAVYEAGKESGQSFISGITEQTDLVKSFAKKVQILLKNGLSESALQQVLNAGLEAGSAIADQLIAGGVDAIKQTNDLLQSLQDLADSVGHEAADKFYLAGITQGEALVSGIESVIANYQGILKNPNLTLKQLLGLSDQFTTDTAFAGITGATSVSAPGVPETVDQFMNRFNQMTSTGQYIINIEGGFATSSEIGQAAVNAIRSFNRTNGPAQIAVSGY